MFLRIAVLSIAFAFVATFSAAAALTPTPVPGGANQVNALSGTIGQTIFNGVLRIDVQELRDATDADNPSQAGPLPNQKVMVMKVLLRNGAHDAFIDLLSYTLADKDDVSVDVPEHLIEHANLHILQGSAGRQSAMFPVDKDFVPVKLIVTCATCAKGSPFKAVRFTIPQSGSQ